MTVCNSSNQLQRVVGLPGAILMALAAVVATCNNGLSSTQLVVNHPVSGGTYEYGHRWLDVSLRQVSLRCHGGPKGIGFADWNHHFALVYSEGRQNDLSRRWRKRDDHLRRPLYRGRQVD